MGGHMGETPSGGVAGDRRSTLGPGPLLEFHQKGKARRVGCGLGGWSPGTGFLAWDDKGTGIMSPGVQGQIEAMGPQISQSACHLYGPARPFAILRTWPALGGAPSSHKGSLRYQNIPTYRKLKLYTIQY